MCETLGTDWENTAKQQIVLKLEAWKAIQRVRELHYAVKNSDCCDPDCTELHSNLFCFECANDEYPCDTIKTLDGEQ